jgi:hypothetical protein
MLALAVNITTNQTYLCTGIELGKPAVFAGTKVEAA